MMSANFDFYKRAHSTASIPARQWMAFGLLLLARFIQWQYGFPLNIGERFRVSRLCAHPAAHAWFTNRLPRPDIMGNTVLRGQRIVGEEWRISAKTNKFLA